MVALTTIDNPYSPFEDFDNWLRYDRENKHKCCELLDRNSFTSESLSDEENESILESSIDEILANDLEGIYIKVRQ